MNSSPFYSDIDNPIGGRAVLRRFCKARGVPMFRAGRRLLVPREDLDAAIMGDARFRAPLRKVDRSADASEEELVARLGLRVVGGGSR